MAEKSDSDSRVRCSQDTGNPILDSLVNLMAGQTISLSALESVHTKLLDLAAKEPGGLKYRTAGGDIAFVEEGKK